MTIKPFVFWTKFPPLVRFIVFSAFVLEQLLADAARAEPYVRAEPRTHVNGTYEKNNDETYDLNIAAISNIEVPAVMYGAINSEIPSKAVIAIVESDVFGLDGKNLLIPKGSKVEGVYKIPKINTRSDYKLFGLKSLAPTA